MNRVKRDSTLTRKICDSHRKRWSTPSQTYQSSRTVRYACLLMLIRGRNVHSGPITYFTTKDYNAFFCEHFQCWSHWEARIKVSRFTEEDLKFCFKVFCQSHTNQGPGGQTRHPSTHPQHKSRGSYCPTLIETSYSTPYHAQGEEHQCGVALANTLISDHSSLRFIHFELYTYSPPMNLNGFRHIYYVI